MERIRIIENDGETELWVQLLPQAPRTYTAWYTAHIHISGYQQGVHRALKQNITTKDKNEYESDFGGRSRVGGSETIIFYFTQDCLPFNCIVKIFMFSNQMIYLLGTLVASLFSILDVIVHTWFFSFLHLNLIWTAWILCVTEFFVAEVLAQLSWFCHALWKIQARKSLVASAKYFLLKVLLSKIMKT